MSEKIDSARKGKGKLESDCNAQNAEMKISRPADGDPLSAGSLTQVFIPGPLCPTATSGTEINYTYHPTSIHKRQHAS